MSSRNLPSPTVERYLDNIKRLDTALHYGDGRKLELGNGDGLVTGFE